jgi:hypothetical protein
LAICITRYPQYRLSVQVSLTLNTYIATKHEKKRGWLALFVCSEVENSKGESDNLKPPAMLSKNESYWE